MRGPLPVYVEDPVARLAVVREAMDGLKDSKQAVGAEVLAGVQSFAPPTVLAQASRINFSTRLFNLIVTNVPGPQFPLYVLGRELLDLFPIAFLPRDHALAVAIMSYNGGIDFGLLGDYDAMPDLDEFGSDLDASLAELVAAAKPKRHAQKTAKAPARRVPEAPMERTRGGPARRPARAGTCSTSAEAPAASAARRSGRWVALESARTTSRSSASTCTSSSRASRTRSTTPRATRRRSWSCTASACSSSRSRSGALRQWDFVALPARHAPRGDRRRRRAVRDPHGRHARPRTTRSPIRSARSPRSTERRRAETTELAAEAYRALGPRDDAPRARLAAALSSRARTSRPRTSCPGTTAG